MIKKSDCTNQVSSQSLIDAISEIERKFLYQLNQRQLFIVIVIF